MLTNMVMLSPSRVRSRVSQMNEERPPHVTCPDHSFYFHGLFRSKALLCTLYHCLLTRFSLKTFFFKYTIQKILERNDILKCAEKISLYHPETAHV